MKTHYITVREMIGRVLLGVGDVYIAVDLGDSTTPERGREA